MKRLHPYLLVLALLTMLGGGLVFPGMPLLGLALMTGGVWAHGTLCTLERQRRVMELHGELMALAAENHRLRTERLLTEEPTGDWPRAN